LHVPPNDLAGIFAHRIRGQHEEQWRDILLGGPEAVGLNPEQRKAVQMTGINLFPVEVERLFRAQLVQRSSKVRIVASSCVNRRDSVTYQNVSFLQNIATSKIPSNARFNVKRSEKCPPSGKR
jgi:hypothetical protein